jgi:ABC-type Fe3+/spermidine/putrescine transport system ATPase subunit
MLGVESIDVRFGEKRVLRDVTLTVEEGESVAVLGPSGSGKSTLLRAVAGLVPVASGAITWDGEDITKVPTHLRGFGLMFQGYALFPHLDVLGNVGFGLRMANVPDEETGRRVRSALELVGLDGFDHRLIADLSGGEKQRVALARTLAPEPRMIMLDEPLGALDRTLRERLMVDMRRILSDQGVTAVVVTHDREEAEALSDRIALMREGSIVQTGTLAEILAHPVDEWVRNFLG